MTALTEVFPVRFSGYWGSAPGDADVDARAIRNGDVGTTGTVAWESLPTRGFSSREVNKALVKANDILLTTSGNCGNVAFVPANPEVSTVATNFVRVLRVDPAKTDPRYAFHFCRTRRFVAAIEPFVRGATIKNLSVEAAFQAVDMPKPSLAEQRRIAAILDHADALRAKRRQVLAHLSSMKQSVLQDLLSEGHDRVALGELIRQGPKNGLYRPASDYGSGTPIVRIDSFKFGSSDIAVGSLKRLRASASQVAEFGLERGDLLINRVNSREHVGKAALVGDLEEPTVYESNMMRIRLDQARVSQEFAVEFMQSRDVRVQVAPMTKDAVNQSSINQSDVKNIRIPLPSIDEQLRFAAFVNELGKRRAVVRRAAAADDELFASLQSRAFRGEL